LALRPPSLRSCQSRASWRPPADGDSNSSAARLHRLWNSDIAHVPTMPPISPATIPAGTFGFRPPA